MDTVVDTIRVVLADSNILFRCGIARLIEAQPDLDIVGEASNYREALQLADELHPDVMLVDVDLDGCDGPTLAELLSCQFPGIHLIFLGTDVQPDCLLRCVLAGAAGYLQKNITPDQLFARIRGLIRGEAAMSLNTVRVLMERLSHSKCTLCLRAAPHPNLTPRECEVLVLVARGMTNKKIGAVLRISEHTVRNHLCSIYQKLNLENRLQVAVYSVTHGLIDIGSM